MKTYEHVYDILSKSPDFVTGESLAKSLGVSRTAIWKAIQTLQEQGIDITSVRKKGYYLEKGDILLPQDISKQLNIPVYFNPDSNSTQLDAKHGMEKNNPTPALYLASSQKAYQRTIWTSLLCQSTRWYLYEYPLKAQLSFWGVTTLYDDGVVPLLSKLSSV